MQPYSRDPNYRDPNYRDPNYREELRRDTAPMRGADQNTYPTQTPLHQRVNVQVPVIATRVPQPQIPYQVNPSLVYPVVPPTVFNATLNPQTGVVTQRDAFGNVHQTLMPTPVAYPPNGNGNAPQVVYNKPFLYK